MKNRLLELVEDSNWPLFNTPAGPEAELDEQKISDDLKTAFNEYGSELVGEPEVEVVEAGSKWKIKDEESTYDLTKTGEKLFIRGSFQEKTMPEFEIGDTVQVHQRILEGNKERVQVFEGTVIARSGEGVRETFTVRRIVQGEGVERIFPIHSPKIADIVSKRKGVVRRAKLYFLRDRIGKATRLKLRLPKEKKPVETNDTPEPTETQDTATE